MKKFNLELLSSKQKQTRLDILNLAYEGKHSHIGSCLSSVDIIDAIYRVKKNDERFVLSNGHAGMALYAVLKKYKKIKNLKLAKSFYIHPDMNHSLGIHVSTGSLGQGLPIALGMAFADRRRDVYCIISDGECAEGSIWESLRVAIDKKVSNLKIVVDANGWAGYDAVDLSILAKRLEGFGLKISKVDGHNIKKISKATKLRASNMPLLVFAQTEVEQFPFLKGQDAHYYVMTDDDYGQAVELLR